MKKYNSMYLGLCVNNDDPQKRGRVQIFVPHVLPALYENWNQQGLDIHFQITGDNMVEGLTSDQVDKLTQILPWAESASPILGTSAPGNLVSAETIGQAVGALAGGAVLGPAGVAVGAAAGGAVGKYFDQTPVAEPIEMPVGDQSSLFGKAAGFSGGRISASMFGRSGSADGLCGVGARSIAGALFNDSYFAQGLGVGGGSTAASLSLGRGNTYLTNSGYYNQPVAMPSGYSTDSSQWQKGDVIVSACGNSKGQGHIQIYTGQSWMSDFTQSKPLDSSKYCNFTLYRANAKGVAKLGGTPSSSVASTTDETSTTSSSGEVAAASPQQSAEPVVTDESSPLYGNVSDPRTENNSVNINSVPNTSITQVPNAHKIRQDIPYDGRYAPVRYNNPGGAYPSSKFIQFGMTGYGKIGGGHPIANYPSVAAGTASNMYMFQNMPIVGKTLGQSRYYWVNGNFSGSYDFGGDFGLSTNEVITSEKLQDSAWMSKWMKATAAAEGFTQRGSNLTDAELSEAFNILNNTSPFDPSAVADGNTSLDGNVGSSSVGDISANIDRPTGLVNTVDRHGTTVTQNLNNMAKGVFSYPAAGSMLWVFFREGNPLHPVYFAASYGQAEWASAYRTGSDAPGYKPAATADNPITSTGGVMNLNGVGGIRWEDTNNPSDRLQDQKSIMFFGEDGSNIFMGKGYNQYFSKYDRRDQVEKDRFESTLGAKEEWVQGDRNLVCMGDLYVKVGNVSAPAVDAVTRIQEIIKEVQAPLSQT